MRCPRNVIYYIKLDDIKGTFFPTCILFTFSQKLAEIHLYCTVKEE